MTVLSRAGRNRRGDRGPGWLLLTSLLVLALLASSTLVFTSRVELLRLAVILSLWAAALGAFVTVIYRRQSELDQARARDMKFVYDLQLDREISARREYELSVESHLRRQLSREVRAQASDEMAALRAELVSLRSQLEVMLGTDLGHRPALESERIAVPMPAAPGRVESSRVTTVSEGFVTAAEETVTESAIIDVPEEPLGDVPEERLTAVGPRRDAAATGPYRPPEVPWRPPEVRLGRHSTSDRGQAPPPPEPHVSPAAPPPPRGRHWVPADGRPVPAARHRGQGEAVREPVVEAVVPEPVAEPVDELQGQHAGGQSVADLMARLQVNGPAGGGGRRRRED